MQNLVIINQFITKTEILTLKIDLVAFSQHISHQRILQSSDFFATPPHPHIPTTSATPPTPNLTNNTTAAQYTPGALRRRRDAITPAATSIAIIANPNLQHTITHTVQTQTPLVSAEFSVSCSRVALLSTQTQH